jgi:hypothetical protein
MRDDRLSQLKKELAVITDCLKQCTDACKGFRTFKNNPPGLGFCADQLHLGAVTLRSHAEELVTMAENLHASLGGMPEQLEMDENSQDGLN